MEKVGTWTILALLIGIILGIIVMVVVNYFRGKSGEKKATKLIDQAKKDAEKQKRDALAELKEESYRLKQETDKEVKEKKAEIKESEDRLLQREKNLDKREEILQNRDEVLDQKNNNLLSKQKELQEKEAKIDELMKSEMEQLENIAKFSKEKAHDLIMKRVEESMALEIADYIKQEEAEAKLKANETAKNLIVSSMQRYSNDVTNEQTVSTISLPNDEMKGRLIGREGRNIRTIESVTGVDLIIDDTPEAVVLSSFDPIRRQVARYALERLMKDGRINPASIEESVAKAEREIEKEVVRAGEDAVREVGLVGIPRELIHLLGELKFRTSYGQNVLLHSVEMAHVAGMIAEEIGADKRVAKTAALMHDMGKAVTHKIEGKHAEIGAELAKKYGMPDEIVHAIAAHHDDIEPTTPEALIVKICDALSAARPGARNISAENFAERMRDLENIATSFSGIDKAYAISAGREVRVIVEPKQIDDLSALKLARDIATKIEATMSYPGVIKVNVIRETRAVEYAK